MIRAAAPQRSGPAPAAPCTAVPARLDAALHAHAAAWIAQGTRAIAVCVTASHGSVPRDAGTVMLVSESGVAGSIGGGRLEWDAIAQARGLLARPYPRSEPAAFESGGPLLERDLALGPALGQCCGGRVALQFHALDARWLDAAIAQPPRFHLHLYGAGHVGRAIARLLAELPCTVTWIDGRDAAFDATATAPHIETVVADPIEAEVDTAPDGAFHLVLTHEHALDLRITETVLRQGRFGFLGLIGSVTKRQRFLRRLADRGVDAAALARLTCPIGIAGIGGKEPAVIAVAAVAQLLQAAEQADPAARLARRVSAPSARS
jgi:xanthine dehydrogenase accessory factor